MAMLAILLVVCFFIVLAAFILTSVRLWQANPALVKKIFRLLALASVYFGLSLGFIILGLRVQERHTVKYKQARTAVQQIWGGSVLQKPPSFTYKERVTEEYVDKKTGESKTRTRTKATIMGIEAQEVSVVIEKNLRTKGLLKFAGYNMVFSSNYKFTNTANESRDMSVLIPLPEGAGNLTKLEVLLNGQPYSRDTNLADGVNWQGRLKPGEGLSFSWSYHAQGSDGFKYALWQGSRTEIGQLKFRLDSEFADVRLANNSMVPTERAEDDSISRLDWNSENLITGQDISVSFLIEGNWGAVVPRLFLFSPLALLMFSGLLFIRMTASQIDLHPMQWLLIGSGFFMFPLFSSYLFSYLPVLAAMAVGLATSTGLMLWYANMISQRESLLKPLALSCLVFQWFFSVAFLFPQHTGFLLTLSIIGSLAWLMKKTAATNWEEKW